MAQQLAQELSQQLATESKITLPLKSNQTQYLKLKETRLWRIKVTFSPTSGIFILSYHEENNNLTKNDKEC